MIAEKKQFADDRIARLQNDANAKREACRQLLQNIVNTYQTKFIYTSRLKKYNKKLATDPNTQKHARLADVDALNQILNSHQTDSTTAIINGVNAYINAKDKFTGLGHFSSLRTKLKSAITKYLAKHNPAEIDAGLNLYIERDQEETDTVSVDDSTEAVTDQSLQHRQVSHDKGKEDLNSNNAKLPSDPVNTLTAQLRMKDDENARQIEANNQLRAENAKLKENLNLNQQRLKATTETLSQQDKQITVLRNQIIARDEHLAARDLLISQQKDTMQEMQAKHEAFVTHHQDYVKKANALIDALSYMFNKV